MTANPRFGMKCNQCDTPALLDIEKDGTEECECGGDFIEIPTTTTDPKDKDDLKRKAEAFAKYHEEHARYGGASREFHERALTFLRTVVDEVRRKERIECSEVVRRFHERGTDWRKGRLLVNGGHMDRDGAIADAILARED